MRGMSEMAGDGGVAHHQALEIMATRALAEGDAAAAFALADRRCRIRPAPEAHSFVLRAETHYRLGRRRFAVRDLGRALDVAPEDVAANRRMLAWGSGGARQKAAATLIAVDRDLATLRAAIERLESGGGRAFAALQVFDRTLRGWVAWHGEAAVSVTVAGDMRTVTTYVEPDPFHPFASATRNAATFEIARADSAGPQAIHVSVGGAVCLSRGAPANIRAADVPATDLAPAADVTVIVPVYADYDATRACLDRLLAELGGGIRAILVDDAAPDPRMAPYLRSLAAHPAVTLLANPRNLGFVAAVNRALAATRAGDVLLLNADTIPPPGFVARLARAARSDATIGIVTAFSNDAELTSFPAPGRANPLGSPDEALALDRVAAEVNAGRIVAIPSGTGFCLYLTRRCLDAVGPLSASFHRGYLEDVELCLRARSLGFRTVCDTSVFVGHAGSRSFGAEKAALALRNFAVLAAGHPGYVEECAAFAAADPLRPARAAIELRAAPRAATRLVVTGTGSAAALAGVRARAEGALLLTLAPDGTARLADAAGGVPQSLAFDLRMSAGIVELENALRAFPPEAVAIVDAASLPDALAGLLAGLACPLDLVLADGGLLMPGTRHGEALLTTARAVIPPTAEAHAFAARRLPPAYRAKLAPPPASAPRRARRHGDRGRLGIVVPAPGPHARALAEELAGRLRVEQPAASLIVLGTIPDAAGLLCRGNALVTGAVAPDELATLVRHHAISHLFVERRTPLFGHPLDEAARATGLPLAFRDWSLGAPETRAGDLALAPDADLAASAAALARWRA